MAELTGHYAAVAEAIREVGERLVERASVEPGLDVLDAATGTGNAALAAVKAGGWVTGLDPEPALLDMARERAADAMIEVDWVEGDPERLPFDDASFDRVLSAFGHLFAPRPERAIAELRRVCRPGGAIGICSWTPEGVGGRLYDLAASRQEGIVTPTLWGSEEQMRELLGEHARELEMERRTVTFAHRSPEAWLDFLAESFAPFGPEPGPQLRRELLAVLRAANQANDGGLRFEQEYLLVVARV